MKSKEMRLEDFQRPLIGIIGATEPTEDYDSDDSYRLGFELREAVKTIGTLFTGGVEGVGLDVYRGISDYSYYNGLEDKCFVMVPNDYNIPKEYLNCAASTPEGTLKVVRAGKDMEERRTNLACSADVFVVVNGSRGTLDEAVKGLYLNKPVICLVNSGGVADFLPKIKTGEVEIDIQLNRDLISPFNSISEVVEGVSKYIGGFRK